MWQIQAPDFAEDIAVELQIQPKQVRVVLGLFEDGNTVPFVARYRKELTGNLDERQLADIAALHTTMTRLFTRKEEVLRLVEAQDILADEEAEQFISEVYRAKTVSEVDDLYRPFRKTRKTRASVARERGLEPFIEWLVRAGDVSRDMVLKHAESFLSDQVETTEDALQGALDIFAQSVADDAETRRVVRKATQTRGLLVVSAVDSSALSVYEMYYKFSEPVSQVAPHRVLAINRGEREEMLRVSVLVPVEFVLPRLEQRHLPRGLVGKSQSFLRERLCDAIADAYQRLIAPAIEREIRNELTEKASKQAVHVFAENLRQLLMQPPIKGRVVLGVDPAYRTGCKLAVVDETGKLLETGVIYPTPPKNQVREARTHLDGVFARHQITLVVIGNGTASRETEEFIADYLQTLQSGSNEIVPYLIVSEAGASVYSASDLARAEFPELDVAQRSAVSIARRVQDPLAELVKIDPKSVGVGQYQHDVAQRILDDSLTHVVESAVNQVGVDLNTASPSLLSYISGLSKGVAQNIVEFRDMHGRFASRRELSAVPRLGPKTFEQCAGFLRIQDGKELLDNTPIHPESYGVVAALLKLSGAKAEVLTSPSERSNWLCELEAQPIAALCDRLGVGEPTLRDILAALRQPGRDVREDIPPPLLRTRPMTVEDLHVGMVLEGTVRNVVDFGAFVDVGLKNDGLVHISQMTERRVKHPLEVVSVGDVVTVKVLQVDLARQRVGLSLRLDESQ